MFQCSSASRKFLNVGSARAYGTSNEFQCSSASRKFLNFVLSVEISTAKFRFSALQRAENSSTCVCAKDVGRNYVSVLFSEPKIPHAYQRCEPPLIHYVSVLFSEPKIPQEDAGVVTAVTDQVSVLFSEPKIPQPHLLRTRCDLNEVSVLFSEPKIPHVVTVRPTFA